MLALVFKNTKAQFNNTAASGPCQCDGSFVFTNPIAGNATYTLSDDNGNQIDQQTNAVGTYTANGLCAAVYLLVVNTNGNSQAYVTNINGGTFSPGAAAVHGVCTTDGTNSLNSFLTAPPAGGVWTNPAGNATTNNINPGNAMPGLYVYTLQNGGCDVTTGVYIYIIQNASPGLSTTYDICDWYQPFQLLTFMAGNPDPNGVWFDIAGNPMDGWFYPATMDSASFVYMIDTVQGCGPVFSVMTVDENLTPDPGLDASVTVCANGSTFNMTNFLAGTPDLNGQWFNSANQMVPTMFDPATMPAGVYRYHLNGESPCVDQNAYLTITFINSNPSGEDASYTVCSNGGNVNMLVALNGNPLAGGTWTNPLGVVTDNLFNPQTEPAGVYSYYYPNVGCNPSNAELTIIVETLPNAGPNNAATICESVALYNLATLLGANTSAGGVWTNSSGAVVSPVVNSPLLGTSNFTYSVTGSVCPGDQSVMQLTVVPQTTAPGNVDFSICSEDAPVDLNNLYSITGLEFYNQQGVAISNIFNPAASSSTIIDVVNPSQNVCPDGTSEIAITVEQPPFDNAADTLAICNSALTYNLNTSNAAINFTEGIWTDDLGNAVSNIVNLNFIGFSSYTFTSNSAQLCSQSVWTFTLNAYQPNEAGQGASYVFCTTDNSTPLTTLLPSSSAGLGAWIFNGTPFEPTVFDPQQNVSGSYFYTIPANGPCPADAAEVEIVVQNGIVYSAGADALQCSNEGGIALGQDNPANCTFDWSPPQDLDNPNAFNPILEITNSTNVPITYEYSVIVNDGICLAYDTVLVTLNPNPTPLLIPVYEICVTEFITLDAGVEGDFTWFPQNYFPVQNQSTQTISPDVDEMIIVNATNQWGCTGADTAMVIAHPMPVAIPLVESVSACPPINMTGALDTASVYCDNVIWNLIGVGEFEGSSFETLLYDSGTYIIELSVSSQFGCSQNYFLDATTVVFPAPVAHFSWSPNELTSLDPIATFENNSIGGAEYLWDFASLGSSVEMQPVFEFPNEEPANYEVCLLVTNDYGCVDSSCKFIHLDNEYVFYAPNAFTPDNDGINDYFLPYMLGLDENTYHIQIYDRWGDLVFESRDVTQPWTGNVRGGSYYAAEDVYAWRVSVKDKEKADYKIIKGHITLIR
jgi:gliding motility-associated-like protein